MKKISVLFAMPVVLLAMAGCGQSPAERAAKSNEQAVSTAAAESVPATSGLAAEYEGKIVRRPPAGGGKEDGWFLVENGKRRWITDGGWLTAHGRSPADVVEIPAVELAKIPEDPSPLGQ